MDAQESHRSSRPVSSLELDVPLGHTSSQAFVVDGWGGPEKHHRWAIGRTSRLRLPVAARGQPHVLVLDVVPWLHPPQVTRQRIMVGFNGRLAGSLAITHPMAVGLPVPAALTTGGELAVSIDHIDGPAGAAFDTYRDGSSLNMMGLSVRLFRTTPRPAAPPAELPPVRVAAADRRTLLAGFESLGHRCAFGLLQQRHGVDQLGLLRFAGLHTPILIRELLRGFEGLGNPPDLHAFIRENNAGLYSVYDRVREIWFNTAQPLETAASEVVGTAARHLPFLRRKFLKCLADGRRVFVVNSPYVLTDAEALALFTVLDMPARNALLWTNQSGPLPPGTVRRQAPGLYFGQLDAAGEVEGDPSDEAWLSVCANVRSLADEAQPAHGIALAGVP